MMFHSLGLLYLFLYVTLAEDCIDRPCVECRHYIKQDDPCLHHGTKPMLFCDPQTK